MSPSASRGPFSKAPHKVKAVKLQPSKSSVLPKQEFAKKMRVRKFLQDRVDSFTISREMECSYGRTVWIKTKTCRWPALVVPHRWLVNPDLEEKLGADLSALRKDMQHSKYKSFLVRFLGTTQLSVVPQRSVVYCARTYFLSQCTKLTYFAFSYMHCILRAVLGDVGSVDREEELFSKGLEMCADAEETDEFVNGIAEGMEAVRKGCSQQELIEKALVMMQTSV